MKISLFLQKVKEKIYPLIQDITNIENVFNLLCFDIKTNMEIDFEKDSTFTFDNILEKTKSSILLKKEFKEKIQKKYKAAVIDEFQDTDKDRKSVV